MICRSEGFASLSSEVTLAGYAKGGKFRGRSPFTSRLRGGDLLPVAVNLLAPFVHKRSVEKVPAQLLLLLAIEDTALSCCNSYHCRHTGPVRMSELVSPKCKIMTSKLPACHARLHCLASSHSRADSVRGLSDISKTRPTRLHMSSSSASKVSVDTVACLGLFWPGLP